MSALARLHDGDPDHARPSTVLMGAGVSLIALLGAIPYLLPAFQVGVLSQILVFGLWASGIHLMLGSAGLVSLGHAGLLGVAAYTVAIGQGRLGLSFWLAAVLAIAVTMGVTALLSLTITRAYGVYFLMITLAQGMLLWGVAQRWVSVTDGDNGLRTARRPEVFSEYWSYYYFVLVVVVVTLLALRWFTTSPAGLRLRALKDSPSRLESLGYSVTRQKLLVFNVAGLLAAISGMLYAGLFQFISPSTVFLAQSVAGLLMVILGGTGFFLGAMVGSTVVLSAETILRIYTDRWSTVMGLLLIVTVLYAPAGISGVAVDLVRRVRGGGQQAPVVSEGDAGETAPPDQAPQDAGVIAEGQGHGL